MAASTGGPAVLVEILKRLPRELSAPILVVQHIAPGFTDGFAEWMRLEASRSVALAQAGMLARAGTVYVAPEGSQLGIGGDATLVLDPTLDPGGFRPSADHLFRSVAVSYGSDALGILLTGMGRDGAAGLLALRRAGGTTVAQDEESSVVYGMPQEAVSLGAAEHVLAPSQIADLIHTLAGLRAPSQRLIP